MESVSSWGRLPAGEHTLVTLNTRLPAPGLAPASSAIAFGMGRSYGDVCLNTNGTLLLTRQLDRFIQFDKAQGILQCEAGILLRDIQRLVVPQGWMLPVTPGTQLATLGGAIANDVHGKNHHGYGTFGNHLTRLRLVRTDGQIIECGPAKEEPWFKATIGGLGLTGIITDATIQLRPVTGDYLDTETIAFENLDTFFHLASTSEANWEYTVAWIDCLARRNERGIFMRANHSGQTYRQSRSQKYWKIPFTPPLSLVNKLTLRPFNSIYFNRNKMQAGKSRAHYESFFYPLDHITDWNKIYGPRGFYQYQCVVPETNAGVAIREILKRIANSGEGSFLAVLKTFGHLASPGMLSFPMPGTTLALDFPNKGRVTKTLFASLDAIVREHNGRIYCAKDARMPRDIFEQGYPQLDRFIKYRDPQLSSSLARRLFGY